MVPALMRSQHEEAIRIKPLIFIIDELDRCKPTFALSLIEAIKHFFSVPGIHFLLVTSLNQIECAVRLSYGADLDARAYLQKFFHLTITLPEVAANDVPVIHRFVDHLMSFLPDDLEGSSLKRQLAMQLMQIAQARGLTLSAIERIASNIAIVLLCHRERHLFVSEIAATLCAMKSEDHGLYGKARRGILHYSEVADFLKFERWNNKSDARAEDTGRWWKYCLPPEELGESDKRMIDHFLWRYHVHDGSKIVRWTV